MHSSRALILTVICGFLVSACTHIAVEPGLKATEPSDALGGVGYSLPMIQYDLAITRTLTKCPREDEFAGLRFIDPTLSFKIDATATGAYVKGESYAIDYDKLSSWMKTSSVSVETYSNGTLKAFNASATDMTGEVVKDVVKSAILVSSLTTGPAAGQVSATASNTVTTTTDPDGAKVLTKDAQEVLTLLRKSLITTDVVVCEVNAEEMVSDRAENRKAATGQTDALQASTKKIAGYTTLAGLKALDSTNRTNLNKEVLDQIKFTADSADLDDKLAKLDKLLGVRSSTLWPRAFNERKGLFELDAAALAKLETLLIVRQGVIVLDSKAFGEAFRPVTIDRRVELRKLFPKLLESYIDKYGNLIEQSAPAKDCMMKGVKIDACLKGGLTVATKLAPVRGGLFACGEQPQSHGTECLSSVIPPPKPRPTYSSPGRPVALAEEPLATSTIYHARDARYDEGLFAREAAQGRLLVCNGAVCGDDDANLAKDDSVYIPQLGQLRFLPFKNGPFQANELSVLITEDGRLQKVEYKHTKAAAQAASAVTADVLTQIRTERDRRQTEQKAADATAKAEAIAARTEATALRTEEAASLQSQIDLLTKTAALHKLQTPATPDQYAALNEEIEANNKQLALLQSKLAIYNAAKAIREAGLPNTP